MDETGGTDNRLARLYARRLTESIGRRNLEGLKILDFGAGRGSMLNALNELGAHTIAIEPYGHEYLKQKKFTVYRNINELLDETLFDGVVSIDVIEHLFTPWEDIAAIKMILKPSAWFFLATPNCGGLNARFYGDRWREARRPGHIHLFTAYTVAKILKDMGFNRIKRMNWFISYSTDPFSQLKNNILRTLRLDGELRYLAYNEL